MQNYYRKETWEECNNKVLLRKNGGIHYNIQPTGKYFKIYVFNTVSKHIQ